MGSLTSLLNLSQTALMADQFALNITANNVSNQNTPGYTCEVATWQSGDTVSINGGLVSTGPNVTAVSQRDRVLDQRLQQQTQIQSQSSTLSSALTQIENIFGLSSTSTSAASTTLGTSIDNFSTPSAPSAPTRPTPQRGKVYYPQPSRSQEPSTPPPASSLASPTNSTSRSPLSSGRSTLSPPPSPPSTTRYPP